MSSNIYQNKNLADLFLNREISVFLNILIFITGFLSTQRFSFEPLNTYMCMFPFLVSLFYLIQNRHSFALSFAVLSLVLVADNGAGIYQETIPLIRYIIYSYCLFLLFFLSLGKVNSSGILSLLSLLMVVLLATVLFGDNISFDALRRDIQVIIIISMTIIFAGKKAEINLPIIFMGFLGYLLGEVVNSSFFYVYEGRYLSYNSLKTICLFPFLYILYRSPKLLILIVLGVLLSQVLLLFGTRMIVLTSLVFILMSYALLASKRQLFYLALFFTSLIFLFSLGPVQEILFLLKQSPYKTIRFLAEVASLQSIQLEVLGDIDQIRYAEWLIFFDRPTIEIILGSGLGTGLEDRNGLLGFVGYNWSSFSPEEINSGVFYNLHDYWTDFGLRFGLIPIFYFFYRFSIYEILKGDRLRGVILGMLLLNATYSMAGLILTSLFFRFFPARYKD